MRGQPGPCLTPGNYPAARRYVRNRKPPPFILWSIGIITCLFFIGAAAMMTIGYLNPFGTVGLSILGVGAVVYFGAILFLVLSCLWVERKYPGMQPLSFKIYSRKPNRMPPTTFTNPNVTGQMPVDTTPSYRMHNELPTQIPGAKTNEIPSTPKDKKVPKIQSTDLDILQEEDNNGGKNGSPDIRLQVHTNNDNVPMNEDTRANSINGAGMEDKSHSQPHGEGAADTHAMDQNTTAQGENDNNVSASPKKEKRVKHKTHHIEVPFEDYPSSDSSTSQSNKKDKSQGILEPKPKGNSQNINSTPENSTSATTGTATSASPKTSAMDKQKEAFSIINNLSPAKEDHGHQRTKTATANVKSSPPAVSKAKEIESHASKATNLVQKDSAKSSPVSTRKMLDVLKNNATNPDHTQESVQEKSQTSALSNAVENILPHKNNLRHDQQNITSPKHRTHNPESPGGSPTPARKMQSPERARKIRKDNAVSNSPPIKRKVDGSSSPTRRLQKRPDNSKAQRPQEQSITIQTFSPSGRKEEIQKKKILQSSPSSQLSDVPSSSSSSPSRQHQQSPKNSPRLSRNEDHTTRTTAFHSSPRNEEFTNRQSRHSLPSSQSSDVPSSPSSSPQRTRRKSPDMATKVQRHKDVHVTGVVPSSSNKKDELHKKHSQPSSQSSDISSSPTSSPVSAKKLLQNKKEQANQSKSVLQQRTSK